MDSTIKAVSKNADDNILKPSDILEMLALIKKHLKKQQEDLKYSEKKVTECIETRVHELANLNEPS